MQPDGPRLAIDYGAACTEAVLVWPDGRWEPLPFDGGLALSSAVHVGGPQGVLVGEAAWRQAMTVPDGFVASPLAVAAGPGDRVVQAGGPDTTVADLAAATLRHVAAAAEARVGTPVADVRLVVPARWGPRRATWFRHVARKAGLGQPRLVQAPIAAADRLLAVGVTLPVGAYILVCDLGAGCEVSVLRRGPAGFELLSTLADPQAGGFCIDERLITTLAAPTVGGSRWAAVHALRDAREALSQQTVVTVPMPSAPPVVLSSSVVDEQAEPVLHQAGDLARQTVAAAELTAEQLAGAYLIGGAAAMPAAAATISARLGTAITAVVQPGFTAVLGAADTGAAPAAMAQQPPAGPPLPPLRRLLGVLTAGVASLILYCHMVFTATFHNGTPDAHRAYYYVLATWGELATAAVFALTACLTAGSMFGAALAGAQRRDGAHPDPAEAPGGRISGGIVLAVTAGLAVAALYGVAAAVYFGLPVSSPLGWAMLPILPAAAVAAVIAWLAGRRPAPPQGWDGLLAFPISSILFTAVGTLLLATWWQGTAPAPLVDWTDAIGRLGGILIGAGIGCTLVRHLALRASLGLLVAFFGALTVGVRGTSILAITYASATALWWAYRLWFLLRLPIRPVPYAGDPHHSAGIAR